MQLTLIALLLIKHCIADYFMQYPWMLRDKAVYCAPGGIAHSGLHGILTTVVLMPFIGFGALAYGLFDFFVHYHVDYIKSNWNVRTQASPSETRYWYAFGLDQLAHMMTYVVIVALITNNA